MELAGQDVKKAGLVGSLTYPATIRAHIVDSVRASPIFFIVSLVPALLTTVPEVQAWLPRLVPTAAVWLDRLMAWSAPFMPPSDILMATTFLGLFGSLAHGTHRLAHRRKAESESALERLRVINAGIAAEAKSSMPFLIQRRDGWSVECDAEETRLRFYCLKRPLGDALFAQSAYWVVKDPAGQERTYYDLRKRVFVGMRGREDSLTCAFPDDFNVGAGYNLARGTYYVRVEARTSPTKAPELLVETEVAPNFPTGLIFVFEDAVDGRFRAKLPAPTHTQFLWRLGIKSRWIDSPGVRVVIESVEPQLEGLHVAEALRLKGYPPGTQFADVQTGLVPITFVDVICCEVHPDDDGPLCRLKVPYAEHGELSIEPTQKFVLTIRATSGNQTAYARLTCNMSVLMAVEVECLPNPAPSAAGSY